MRVLIIGARGQLGTDLVRELAGWDVSATTSAQLDVCDFGGTRRLLLDLRPELVINTSAYHRVDDCEHEAERAFLVNAHAVRNLAMVCAELDAVLTHFSTDYVFGGERDLPYTESDLPGPLSVYGNSKLSGEHMVRVCCPRHFIVRTCGLYGVAGASGKGGNFVETMLRLARDGKPIRVVDDQVLTPTYTLDLAKKIKELVETDAFGLYHLTSNSSCSWFEFAAKVFELTGVRADLAPTTSAAFAARAKRPAYSVLDNTRMRALGFQDMRPWQEALAAYLQEKGHMRLAA
ncbi:MAG: dTDP-4-dehydrorhamnose reductase [Planctomycetes bacterium]|nr:dTDP-4-dehydrorhamnose reductase [Planctomycetota bacterium]